MLLEAVNFAATYILSPRRIVGEINASVTLWARARRCAGDWAAHEIHSKTFVLKVIGALAQRRVAVVLGSGLLRDVPIEVLSSRFREVWLYDLQHLASVRLWAAGKGMRNLRFVNRDLSGYDAQTAAPEPLAFLHDMPDLDLVVSANLLSQIGVGIGRLTKGEPVSPVPKLLRAHLEGLSSLAATTCLITDVSYEVIDRSGTVLERDDLMHGIALPVAQAEWPWPVAPLGEIDRNYRALHRVMAVTFKR